MPSKKWKRALLSSGLPLEYLVAQKLGENNFLAIGEYSYTRQNEQDINTEFSVDLLAMRSIDHIDRPDHWGKLHLLAECKYRHCGTKWVFAPHPSPPATNMDLITVNQALCTKRVTYGHLIKLYSGMQHCLRGVELQRGGKKANPNDIAQGLFQLRYAVSNLVHQGLSNQINARNDGELYIQMVCPMLVTTATLYVLKRGLDLEDFHKASELTDVAEEADALIVNQKPGPQLQKYCESLFADLQESNRRIEAYMNALGEILKKRGYTPDTLPNLYSLLHTILSSSQLILVVNYNALDERVNELWNLVECCSGSLECYTTLKKESRQDSVWGTNYEIFFADEAIPE